MSALLIPPVKAQTNPAPTLSSISPTVASTGGGTIIQLTGQNFLSGATVTFGQGSPVGATYVNSTTLQVTAPSAAQEGSVTVTVTNPDTQYAYLPQALTYDDPPSLTAIQPSSGSAAGGYKVTLTGQNFRCGAQCPNGPVVLFGSTSSTNVIFNSSTQLTVTVPAGAAGTVSVSEANTDGLNSNVLTSAFTYNGVNPPPTLTSLSPTVASTSGGTIIQLTGQNFLNGATVTFGQGSPVNATYVNSTTLQVTAPSAAQEGSVTVTVTNPDSQSSYLSQALTYDDPPSLSAVSPASGSALGGYTVTLTGQNFRCGTQCPNGPVVLFGSTPSPNVIFNSSTQLTVTVPAGTAGIVNVSETNTDGLASNSLANAFTYTGVNPPPTLSSISPTVASTSGGTAIQLTGQNFLSGATVTFGQGSPVSATYVNSTTLQVTAPPATQEGSVTVTVTNPDTQSSYLSQALTYDDPPSLSSVSPASGSALGGFTVTLTGQNFRCGTQCPNGPVVLFGSTPSPNVIFNSSTQLTVTVPAGTAGMVNVSETNTDGLASNSLANAFTYTGVNPPPTLSSISPTVASTGGGTVIQLTGTNFLNGATVTFGQGSPVNATYISSTTLQATAPSASAEGSATVTVTNPDAQYAFLSQALTYDDPPSLTSVTPSSGSTAGGYNVQLNGQFFRCGSQCPSGPVVLFGSTPSPSVMFNSNSNLTVAVPAGTAGTVNITETNTDGLSTTLTNGFTYTGTVITTPTISAISPGVASTLGGTVITITGSNFVTTSTVTFGSASATSVTFVSSTTLQATAPASASGVVSVSVTNPGNLSATLPNALTYDVPPSVTSVSPTVGTAAGGYTVAVTGQNFVCGQSCPGSVQVLFGTIPATQVVFNSSTSLTVTVPANPAGGLVNLTVTNVDGLSAVLPNAFTYTGGTNPVITSVSPSVVSVYGGTLVTITGTGFVSGSTVAFGASNATNVTVVNSTTITATAPASPLANEEGAVSVFVTNPSNYTAVLPQGLTYHYPPSITSISPNSGPAAGGYTVQLTGQYFRCLNQCATEPVVLFGSTPSPNVVFSSNALLTVTVPVNADGSVNVTETNPDGLSTVLTSGFTFTGPVPPIISSLSPTTASTNGGTVIKITGSNFVNGATVIFGSLSATKVVFVNSTTLNATTPASNLPNLEGTVTVTVTNPGTGGLSYSLPQGLTYHLPPTLTSISPNSGPAGGGYAVTLAGQYFRCTAGCATQPTVLFGATPATNVIFHSNASVTATVPAHATGTVNVTETNPDGLSTTLTGGFTYQGMNITDVSPAIGPISGGESVTITGTGFSKGTTVSFGGTNARSTTFVSATQLTAVTAAHVGGAVNVGVQNSETSFNLASAYQYTAGPVVLAITPGSGAFSGGNRVMLSGYNLTPVNSVQFGPNAAKINSTTASTVDVTVPAYTTGANPAAITVSSSNGTEKLPGAYQYGLAILTQGLDNAYPGIPYSNTLQAAGGKFPYTWSITSGKLPAGLTLNAAAGIISGTPSSSASYGSYTITAAVKDSAASPATGSVTLSFDVLFGFNPGPISPTLFGMILYNQQKWSISTPIGALGKGLGTTWPFIEQTQGVYNFSVLNQYIADAQSHFVMGTSTPLSLYWTADGIPPWAVASGQQNTCSAYPGSNPPLYQCTGNVANVGDVTTFMNALVSQYQGQIGMYELWDEPNVTNVWTGTIPQMVAMTQAAYDAIRANDPNAVILTPSSTSGQYLQDYLTVAAQQAPELLNVDGVAIHGYPDVGTQDVPEAIIGFKSVNVKLAMLAVPGFGAKPIWDTESSWGRSPCTIWNPSCQANDPGTAISDPNERAGYVMRSYLLHWAAGIQNFYWYGWDAPNWGTLWYPAIGTTLAGTAYATTENWMIGATMPQPCSMNGGTVFSAVYTCTLTRPGGYTALAVWDTNQNCTTAKTAGSPSVCTYSSYTPSPLYTQYRDVNNVVHLITPGQPLQVGAVPILLENIPASPITPPPFNENVSFSYQGLTPAYGATAQQTTYEPLVATGSNTSPAGACTGGETTVCNLVTVPGLSAPVPQVWMPPFGAWDSDANVAVGATQVMQWADFGVQLYTKASSGAITPIGNAVSGAAFWSSGSPCASGVGADGMVNYDKAAQVWLVAMRSGLNSECIAVSQTSDATQQYYQYLVTYMDPNGNPYQMDWPRLGVWSDGYYLTFDMLDPANDFAPVYAVVCTLERSAMISGSPSPSAACQQTSKSNTTGFFHLMPADIDSKNPPAQHEPETIYTFAKPAGATQYHLYVYKFYTNFTVESGNILQGPYQVDADSFSTVRPACDAGGNNCVPQPAPATAPIDSVGGYLMYRAAYRNFGGHESVMITQAVQADSSSTPDPNPVGVRWYELRNISSTPTVFQQGFLESANSSATADGFYRWMSSSVMDSSGNMAIGYTISGPKATSYYSGFPGIAIDWRHAAATTPGVLQTEQIVFPGVSVEWPNPATASGKQYPKLGRWGAVSGMAIDPVDQCTFYFTGQYQPTAGTFDWSTQIVSFQLPPVAGGTGCTEPVGSPNWPPANSPN